jgi:methionine-rich copper-binding protein CopC
LARYLSALALGAAIIMSSAPALADSRVKSTDPTSGSILNRSPGRVVVNFNEPARMTSVVVAEAGKGDRKLAFTPPEGSTTSFRIHAPDLGVGRNEIIWKALSKDGDPIVGSIVIVIKAG